MADVAFLACLLLFKFCGCTVAKSQLRGDYHLRAITLSLSFILDKVNQEMFLNVHQTTYKNNSEWFGIAFNTQMTPANAIVFTTGKPNNILSSEPKLYSYHLSMPDIAGVTHRGSKYDWQLVSQTINQNELQAVYYQSLNLTDWDVNTTSITFVMAWGTSGSQLTYHGNNLLNAVKLNLITNSVTTVSNNIKLWRTVHAVLMMVAWFLLAPLAIFASAFRTIIPKVWSGLWFKLHRALQVAVVLLSCAAFVIIYLTIDSYGEPHFSDAVNVHPKIGLAVFILTVLQATSAFLRPHSTTANHAEKRMIRIVWEYQHKITGYLSWVGAQIVMFYGCRILWPGSVIGEIKACTLLMCESILIVVIYIGCRIYVHTKKIGFQKQPLLKSNN